MDSRDSKGRFLSGRKETFEEKLKRKGALNKAWKNREDYIADLKKKCPRIYNVWRAFMFTEKGKLAGHSNEWSSFKVFLMMYFLPILKELLSEEKILLNLSLKKTSCG